MTQEDLKKKILQNIEEGNIKMRPKWQFVLQSIIVVLGIVFGFLFLFFVSSLIIFSLKQTGLIEIVGLGPQGVGLFVRSLPWLLMLVAALIIFVIEIAMKKYTLSYRKPLVYSVTAIIIFTILASVLLANTTMHSRIASFSEERNVPIMRPLYKTFGEQRLENVHRATVISYEENILTVQFRRGEMGTIEINEKTRMRKNTTFQNGDEVVVIGKRFENSVAAHGIKKIIDSRERPMEKNLPRRR